MSDRKVGDEPGCIVVAVLTYRRTTALARLLPRIVEQAQGLERAQALSAAVLVVDNDPSQSARAVVAALDEDVVYVHEATPGIAAARARAVTEAGDALALVFIDDDEEPSPTWLGQLVATWMREGHPAAVVGRVSSVFPGAVDPWVAASGYFDRRNYPTGTEVAAGSSANLLLDLRVLRKLNLNFDARLGLRGGEDTALTKRLVALGHRLVWCAEAEVFDLLPVERVTRSWVLRRAFSHGVVASRVELELSGRPRQVRIRLVLAASARIVGGAARTAWGCAVARLDHRSQGQRVLHRGSGMLSGALGRDVHEYDRVRVEVR